eukprot:NODE_426_length_7665_cov_0.708961.p8 type:complete len:150 gc:universal NODE_426_length_7665_cov_0.708961:2901-2452(-)
MLLIHLLLSIPMMKNLKHNPFVTELHQQISKCPFQMESICDEMLILLNMRDDTIDNILVRTFNVLLWLHDNYILFPSFLDQYYQILVEALQLVRDKNISHKEEQVVDKLRELYELLEIPEYELHNQKNLHDKSGKSWVSWSRPQDQAVF